MSLIQSIELIQGDSSDIYEFSSDDFPDLGDVNWVSSWNIREKNIDGVVLASGELTKKTDLTAFVFQVLPTESSTITPGKQFLTIEVKNTSVNFNLEIVQCYITIKKQGVI